VRELCELRLATTGGVLRACRMKFVVLEMTIGVVLIDGWTGAVRVGEVRRNTWCYIGGVSWFLPHTSRLFQ
jgi:hypothetical protein